jgi:transposase-like protein
MKKQEVSKTMLQAVRQFSDPQVAHSFFVQIRFPNGVACPRMGCGSSSVAYLAKYRRWYCNDCKKQFSAKVGTIFEDSPIGLDKWLPAIWLIASNRNGISSYEIARGLDVTQKTAWFMLHRIREAMKDKTFTKVSGPVESDETYIGAKQRSGLRPGDHRGRKSRGPAYGKQIVQGIVERKGDVRAFVIPSINCATLTDKIREHVQPGATVYTDALASYNSISDEYVHHVINHAVEYVRGHVHTNNIEGFRSVFKRTLKGTYVAPRPEHLQAHVEEQVYRFNPRHDEDGERFAKAVKETDGKRLTSKNLTGKA